VSIGATLASARRHAGLTVLDVSTSTRVRENIIRGIEHDDYSACGGDFYARGHIRAIAEAVGTDPVPLIEEFDERWQSSPELTLADVFQPSIPLRMRERRRVRWTGLLAVLILAVLGFASYKFAVSIGQTQHAAAVNRQHPSRGSRPSSAPSAPSVQGNSTQASRTANPTVEPSARPTPTTALTPASEVAFGPGGGDDPQQAALAVSGNPATPWHTDWYTTPFFGNLYAGTGLLLDMGRMVTVSSVRLSLGVRGVDLQLRAGSRPVLADLHTVATAAGAGGTVQLSLTAPVHALYLLVWFTKLPPDHAGTYQASIYRIEVRGQRLFAIAVQRAESGPERPPREISRHTGARSARTPRSSSIDSRIISGSS
jgi:cytoskeletal protein RodZ